MKVDGMPVEILYNLHDSTIISAAIGPRREMHLGISLYTVYYPNGGEVGLRFGGIKNFHRCCRFVDDLNNILLADQGISWRIDAFRADSKRLSKPGDLFFYLEVDHLGDLSINCTNPSVPMILRHLPRGNLM
jgi:hypothetical protein